MKNEKPSKQRNEYFNADARFWYRILSIMPTKQLLLSICLGTLRIVLSAAWPFFLYQTLKQIGVITSDQVLINMVFVVLMLVFISIATHWQSKINIRVLKMSTLELIDRVWKKMNALDWLTFHGNNRVYYFDMLMVEAWRLRAGISALLESLIVNSLIAAVMSLFIIFISWPLFLLCFAGLLVMALGFYLSSRQTRPHLKSFHRAWRDQHQWVSKTVDQFDLIKMGRAYQESAESNQRHSTSFLEVNSTLLTCQAKWRNINQLIGNIVRISVFVMGLYWVKIGIVGLDDLLLSLLVVSIVQSNLMQIPAALNNFTEAQESLKTISRFFDLPEEDQPRKSHTEPIPLTKISIRDLSYEYQNVRAVGPLNLELQRGKIYLWKGRNGSGKSTAAHILLGLLRPKHGSLAINDQVADWSELARMRERFAFLNQDSPIFMGSIKENALFGHQQPLQAWEALTGSWLASLVPNSSQGANRMVGERGEGLSGGEAKRIALIRELLRSSDLLILDEPLNHLDEYAISEIKREIQLMKYSTIIIIISHQNGFENIADEIKEF